MFFYRVTFKRELKTQCSKIVVDEFLVEVLVGGWVDGYRTM